MNKITLILGENIDYITMGGTIVLFSVVGKQRIIIALVLRMIASAMDMIIGYFIAKYINFNVSSNKFGRGIIKRSFVLALGGFLTIVFWHIASILDGDLSILVGAIPIGYFHIFTLQELISIMEHGHEIDPDNRAFYTISKLFKGADNKIRGKIDKVADDVALKYDSISGHESIDISKDRAKKLKEMMKE